jgi:hypothetical protein
LINEIWYKCFIFDLDNAPTTLQSTRLVKVLQWRRRCLENYLIDQKIIYDLLNDKEISRDRIEQRGEVGTIFRDIAIEQLREVVARSVYESMSYEHPGIRPREIRGKSYRDIGNVFFVRLQTMQGQLPELDDLQWCDDFVARCEAEHRQRLLTWETDWLTLCDGKRFFQDLHQRYGVKVSHLKLKKLIVERMERENSDSWVLVQQLLTDALRV